MVINIIYSHEGHFEKYHNILKIIEHFTGTGGNETGVDLVLIQPILLYYVNQVDFFRKLAFFKHNFQK